MSDVHALPTPIVADAWADVDTSIDGEEPEYLSEDQFARHIETVTELLASAGLTVTADKRVPGALLVVHPDTRNQVELHLHEDRSAQWELSARDDAPENTLARELAARIATLLGARSAIP